MRATALPFPPPPWYAGRHGIDARAVTIAMWLRISKYPNRCDLPMSDPSSNAAPVVAVMYATDLLFRSRVAATARALGCRVAFTTSPGGLIEKIDAHTPRRAFIDMDADRADEAVRAAAARMPAVDVIAFFAHVNVAQRQAALDAGAGTILTRGRFAADIESIMKSSLDEN